MDGFATRKIRQPAEMRRRRGLRSGLIVTCALLGLLLALCLDGRPPAEIDRPGPVHTD